MIVTKYV